MLDNIVQENIPTVIDLKIPLVYPDSTGVWLRLKDNLYYNSFCPGAAFNLGMFKSYLDQNKAEIRSYNPNSKETLLNMFPKEHRKQMHEYILELYSDKD